ncbi:hypothetical protein [Gemmobacter denitrificans]|uniref:hypothetical protein n=1 Tax=Gemmobacter denitrificans TaxID=3123040 RepID=UPI0030007043
MQGLRLSEAGAAQVPVLAALAERNDATCFAGLNSDEQATLMALLQKLATAQGLQTPPIG